MYHSQGWKHFRRKQDNVELSFSTWCKLLLQSVNHPGLSGPKLLTPSFVVCGTGHNHNPKETPSESLQVQQLWIPRQLKPSKGLKHLSQKALGESALGQQGAQREQQQLGMLSASC